MSMETYQIQQRLIRSQWLLAYNKLNNSFGQKMVFRLGASSGFFSEYNNMVLALLYCLKNKIKFVLYTRDANFALDKGWTDFFEPFSPEATARFNTRYNLRPYQIVRTFKQRLLTRYNKFVSNTAFLTQDIWDFHRDRAFANVIFNVPELNMHWATTLEAAQIVIANIWVYSEPSQAVVNKLRSKITFPGSHVGIHIRSGDKFLESELYNIDQYMNVAKSQSGIKDAFVLTDDYTVIQQLEQRYPDWTFQTLCEKSERGYFHQEFIKQTKEYRYQQHLKLFASLDICADANAFIGTYSSNPGMYMGMRIGESKCHCLDFNSWVIW